MLPINYILTYSLRYGILTFLDLKFNVDTRKNVICEWYQKSTDTGTILNFRSCSPLHYKKNRIEGAVHRIFGSKSNWSNFDEVMMVNRKQ